MSSASNGSGTNNGVECHCDADRKVWEPSERIKSQALLSSMAEYEAMYRESVDEPEKFWSKIATQFHWKESPGTGTNTFLKYNFDHTKGPVSIKWMEGGITNVCYNAVDRHIGRRARSAVKGIGIRKQSGHQGRVSQHSAMGSNDMKSTHSIHRHKSLSL